MHLVHRQTCRICGSSALTPVIDLGPQYLQGSFVKPGKELPPQRRIPTLLLRCDPVRDEKACGLLQMAHSVPPEILYSAYWYRSGTNRTMRDHLRAIADEGARLLATPEAAVLDIGCNDGTLLACYPDTYLKFGVDPSDVAQEIKGNVQVIQDTFPSHGLLARLAGRKLDLVTSIAMFYDLEDPVGFARSIKQVLSDRGVWIFEMSYMPEMLQMNSYDTICHEHLEYYSLAVIEHILRQAGLMAFNCSLNNINGGSLRVHVTHQENFAYRTEAFHQNLKNLRQSEFDLELDTDKPYRNFQQRIDRHRAELHKLLHGLKRKGKRIHIYGASTKGNTILQWCGIDHRLIDVAAERNPDKYGAKTLGTDIPIVSEEESRKMNPDYYLVLPWHFKEEFLEREKEMIDRGTGLIFPLPEIQIIKK